MSLSRPSKSYTLLSPTLMKSFTRSLTFMNWSVWDARPWSGTTFWSPRYPLILKSSPRWDTFTSKSLMNSRLSTTTRKVTDTTPPKLMLSVALVCITPNRICSRRPSSTSKELVKSSLRKSNGVSWLPVVTAAWTYSTRLYASMKRFMKKIPTTWTASAD